MSTPSNQMPQDVSTLQNTLRSAVAKLMAQHQTINELMKANVDLRAHLHLAQTDKAQQDAYIQALLNTPAENAVASNAPAVSDSDETNQTDDSDTKASSDTDASESTTDSSDDNADPVSP